VTLLGRLTRSWVERDLQGGDLSCLRDFALFRNRRPASAVIDRLCECRFMAKTARMRRRITLKGWTLSFSDKLLREGAE
jgi:hypothetical protein